MGKISVLPDTLCNQIAAGEVVERPAAVVKELVENSIDAGSRKISIFLLEGGRKEIRVVDNGAGMSYEDALLALERHATSKIKTIEDLQAIHSLGFRGEALPSIAAVSRFELITKEAATVSGVHVRIEGGVLKDVREVGCPAGTMIIVRDLFHNIPVRRKFLRSVDTEISHISDQFLRLSMAHPGIHFQLTHQERLQYDFTQAKGIQARVGQALGTDLAGKLTPFSLETPSLRLHGLASPPDLQRANGQSIFAFVNGRPVRDRTLNHAVLSAYDTLIPKGKFPLVVIFIEIEPALVDVNVHPTKREVRFRNPGEILQTVRQAIRKALQSSPSRTIFGASGSSRPIAEALSASESPYDRQRQSLLEGAARESPELKVPAIPVQVNAFPDNLHPFRSSPPVDLPREKDEGAHTHEAGRDKSKAGPDSSGELLFSRLPVLGQLANTYILLEARDGLLLIDQHAAHERIVYDRLSSASVREPAQRLARSVVLDFMPREAAVLRRWIAPLLEIGFEIEPFGGESFVVHAVPAVLGGHSPDILIRELLQATHEEDDIPRLDILANLAKTVACHSAIRAGQKLKPEEVRYLLESLDRTKIPDTCPHGRPLWFKLTHGDIARFFQRT